jgi:hypothetical protein
MKITFFSVVEFQSRTDGQIGWRVRNTSCERAKNIVQYTRLLDRLYTTIFE